MRLAQTHTIYELLLEANRLYAENQMEEAARIYREVLQRNPSPTQRQVAETQLRALGHLPQTSTSSVHVVQQPVKRGGIRQRQMRPMAPLFPEKADTRGSNKDHDRHRPPSQKRPQNSMLPKIPASRTDRIRQAWDEAFAPSPKNSTDKKWMTAKMASEDPASALLAKRQEIVTPLPRAVCTQTPLAPKSSPTSASPLVISATSAPWMGEAQRKGESEQEYQQRLYRYSVWMEKQQIYPGIDLNTALRLAETGWTLEELRHNQQQRKHRYLERRRQFYEEKVQRNQTFSGTQYCETLITERIPLRVFCSPSATQDGILVRNDLYHWCLQEKPGIRVSLSKVRMELVCEKELLSAVLELCRLDQQQHDSCESVPVKSVERLHIPDHILMRSLQGEIPLLFQTYTGILCWGWVFWYDPYQLSVVLHWGQHPQPAGEEVVEVVLFRHAIKSVREQQPIIWTSFPSLSLL